MQYLNAAPLIHAYDGDVVFDHPSTLARELAAGRLDAALVPVFEVLRDPVYDLVDGVAVASDGLVHSVVLAYRGELRDIRSVILDPASLTSVHLLQVLFAEFYGLRPEYRHAAECPSGEASTAPAGWESSPIPAEGSARLLIGNQAILSRAFEQARSPGLHWLDLSEAWHQHTGLPFVFAVWALRPGLSAPLGVPEAFRALKEHGLESREFLIGPEVTAPGQDPLHDPVFRRRYLTEHIRYDLGPREKEGLARYRALLAKWRLIASADLPLRLI